ncbi:hypothetical protein WA026_014708 [Henosepilachna vigintioctopunctata]|uniref:Uncharacterized protein n=1 Tax=Henosepilachna vigintioctopunctata TaxID=420089 RepID=A0AAW1VDX3_9CUCU
MLYIEKSKSITNFRPAVRRNEVGGPNCGAIRSRIPILRENAARGVRDNPRNIGTLPFRGRRLNISENCIEVYGIVAIVRYLDKGCAGNMGVSEIGVIVGELLMTHC